MNKYIRTGGNDTWEDVYEVIGQQELYWEIKDKSIPKCIALISKCNVIKQSDKLEDLVDEFVCESNEEGNNFFKTYKDKWLMLNDDFWIKYKEHYNFYAGIRVKGRGLIYVVKINSNGELELL